MTSREHKRELLRAFIAGIEEESHWKFKWLSLPLRGRISRIRKFLIWYNNKTNSYEEVNRKRDVI